MRPPLPSLRPRPYLLWPLIVIGISALSCASILIRLADAPALTIATYRVAVAALLLIPYYSLKRPNTTRHWSGRVLGRTLLAGLFLALHFALWVRSVQLTSIASAATLVSTTPLFVALFSYFSHGEQLPSHSWLGILSVVAGSGLIAGNDFAFSQEALFGDLLALAGALAATGYLLVGRLVRRSLDLAAYTLGAYGSAALFFLAFNLYAAAPLSGFSNQTYLVFLLLALIPQLIGHTTFNWTLGFLSPTTVAVLILGEPIGATLLAYCFFGETLSPGKAAGLLILGTGIVLAAATCPDSAP
jgi:drug/metabolite transporter (DMT)-like permease